MWYEEKPWEIRPVPSKTVGEESLGVTFFIRSNIYAIERSDLIAFYVKKLTSDISLSWSFWQNLFEFWGINGWSLQGSLKLMVELVIVGSTAV